MVQCHMIDNNLFIAILMCIVYMMAHLFAYCATDRLSLILAYPGYLYCKIMEK